MFVWLMIDCLIDWLVGLIDVCLSFCLIRFGLGTSDSERGKLWTVSVGTNSPTTGIIIHRTLILFKNTSIAHRVTDRTGDHMHVLQRCQSVENWTRPSHGITIVKACTIPWDSVVQIAWITCLHTRIITRLVGSGLRDIMLIFNNVYKQL